MSGYLSKGTRRENAQGMVEFALVLPILLLIMLGIIEFGRLMFMYSAIASASREGARYGAAVGDIGGGTYRYQDCAGIRAAAKRIGGIVGIEDANITIQYDDGTTIKSTSCPPSVSVELADRIIVTVAGNFQPIVPLVDIPPIPISATTARTIIKDVEIKGTPAPTSVPPKVDTPTPTSTATSTNTPTPTTLPPCSYPQVSTSFQVYEYSKKSFYSVYLGLQNSGPATAEITQIDLVWPLGVQGLESKLQEIRFDTNTGKKLSCNAPKAKKRCTCIWEGDILPGSFSVCSSGCDGTWSGSLSDRQLDPGETHELRFVFSRELPSGTYATRIIINDMCYIQESVNH